MRLRELERREQIGIDGGRAKNVADQLIGCRLRLDGIDRLEKAEHGLTVRQRGEIDEAATALGQRRDRRAEGTCERRHAGARGDHVAIGREQRDAGMADLLLIRELGGSAARSVEPSRSAVTVSRSLRNLRWARTASELLPPCVSVVI